jgi:hypothetical protein
MVNQICIAGIVQGPAEADALAKGQEAGYETRSARRYREAEVAAQRS